MLHHIVIILLILWLLYTNLCLYITSIGLVCRHFTNEEREILGSIILKFTNHQLVNLLHIIDETDPSALVNIGNDWDFDLYSLNTQVSSNFICVLYHHSSGCVIF